MNNTHNLYCMSNEVRAQSFLARWITALCLVFGLAFLYGATGSAAQATSLWFASDQILLDETTVESACITESGDNWIIRIKLNSAAKAEMERLTGLHKGKLMVMFTDADIQFVARIHDSLAQGIITLTSSSERNGAVVHQRYLLPFLEPQDCHQSS